MSGNEPTRVAGFGLTIPPGTRLNGIFEIEKQIGAGGMGMVYRAHNVETGDAVAIKIVRAEMADNLQVIALFRKEAAVLNQLFHDAIVRYYLFTSDPGIGRPYLATEFVEGTSLSDITGEGSLSRNEVLSLAERLADGLRAAHALSIFHRDISPDNVILPARDVKRAKIIDFGIARAATIGGGTVIGDSIAGKFDYMSPEQLGLYGGSVDARSDIYSLGIVLAEAMLGRGLNMGGTQLEVVEKRRKVPDLSGVEPGLRGLLTAMTQPKPQDRVASMGAVVEQAHALRTGISKKGGARPWAKIAAGVVVASLVAGGGALYLTEGDNDIPPDAENGPPPLMRQADSAEPARAAPPALVPVPDPAEDAVLEADARSTANSTANNAEPVTNQAPPPESPLSPPAAITQAPPDSAPDAEPEAPPPEVAALVPETAPAPEPGTAPATAAIPDAEPPVAQEPAAIEAAPAPDPEALPDPAGTGEPVPSEPADATVAEDTSDPDAFTAPPPEQKASAEPTPPEPTDAPGGTASVTHDTSRPAAIITPVRVEDEPAPITPPDQEIADDPAPDAETIVVAALPDTPETAAEPEGVTAAEQVGSVPVTEAAPDPEAPPVDLAAIDPDSAFAPSGEPQDSVLRYVRQSRLGPCTHIRLTSYGEASAVVDAFGDTVPPFQEFDSNFKESNGFEAQINLQIVTPAQCPLVDLADAVAPRDEGELRFQLDKDIIKPGDVLSGAVTGLDGRDLRIYLVASDGRLYGLDDLITRGQDDAALHTVMSGTSGPESGHLLLALAGNALPAVEISAAGSAAAEIAQIRAGLTKSSNVEAVLRYFKYGE
ncbi:protein kinase [Acuticoccus sp. MNP-M23]|uniref:serine/threonine-protein kinase n=1 Tax=Acuticoccus sp. MNP-M23 TaxID=3072793 RepID=UPI0028160AE7|nr:protein kinase [Acuticoccus sp. MNP-M23]WMS44148.1 protein kinase [Acuticoccus sp. MNP-M23]